MLCGKGTISIIRRTDLSVAKSHVVTEIKRKELQKMGRGTMLEVSKREPCPICGHDHACKFLENENGTRSVMCLRIHGHGGQLGADNKRYVWRADSKDGGWSIYAPYIERSYYPKYSNKSTNVNFTNGNMQFKRPEAQKEIPQEELIEPLPNERMNEICRFLLSKLVLDKRHAEYLKKQGWTDMLIMRHLVKSFPEADSVRAQYGNRTASRNMSRKELASQIEARFGKNSLRGFPGAYIDENGNWTFAGPSGIVFPMYDTNGNIFRLRIRMDFLDIRRDLNISADSATFTYEGRNYFVSMKGVFETEHGSMKRLDDDSTGRKGKYRTLSSYTPDRATGRNMYHEGTRSANEASVYTSKGDMMNLCYIVEGEPKSIYSNFKLKAPVLSVPGVNSFDVLFRNGIIDEMVKKGTELFIVAYDADKATNQMVLDFEKRLVNALKEKDLRVAIADWEQTKGKGLDDLLAAGFIPSFRMV